MENLYYTKFTFDGKKVAVVKELESTKSFLVREVYIADGEEFLFGEVFQISKLYDEAPSTWQERRLQEIKSELEREEQTHKAKLAEFEKKKWDTIKRLKNHLESFQKLINTCTRNSETEVLYKTFQTLSDFVLDRIKYFVVHDYSTKIVKFEEYMFDKDGDLRLLSLFGADNGSLTWSVNQYRDGSGTNYRVVPCRTLADAKIAFAELLNTKEHYFADDVTVARKFRIKLDPKKLKEFNLRQRASIEAQIRDRESRIEVQQLELKQLKSKLRVK